MAVIDKINVFRKAFISISLDKIVKYFVLAMILLIALVVRLSPIRYGAYINEFDPHAQYYLTTVIVDSVNKHGISGFLNFFNYHTDLTWQPEGVKLGLHYFPGVPYTGAVTYFILKGLGLGVSIRDIAIYLPVLFGILSVFVVFLIGKAVKNEFTGLISALFYSIAPSVISRSDMGWYDTDGIGMLYLLASIYFLILSLKSHKRDRRIVFSILSGLSAGLLGITWGAFPYIYTLFAVLTFLVVILFNEIKDYEYTYFPAVIIMTIIASSIPSTKGDYLIGSLAIIQYLAASILILSKFIDIRSLLSYKKRIIGLGFFTISIVTIFLSISPTLGVTTRQLIVALPILKSHFVFATTVQEQAGSSFLYFFRDLNILLPFTLFGLYILIKNWKDNIINSLLIIIAFTSLYAASTFVRLLIISTPFLAIVAAIGISEIFHSSLEKIYKYTKRPGGETRMLKNILLVFVIIFVLLSSMIAYTYSISRSMYPATILTGGSRYLIVSHDWLQALEWMKANVGKDQIVASWWDYGYWISFIAGKKTLADNGTMNLTRIKLLAEMFMSDEDTALRILRELNASYILIYLGTGEITYQGMTYYTLYGWGEDGKFIQIARIAGVDPSTLWNPQARDTSFYTNKFWNTFLGKLIPYKFLMKGRQGNRLYDIFIYSPKYPTEYTKNAKLVLVFRSTDPAPGEVIIYKIIRTS